MAEIIIDIPELEQGTIGSSGNDSSSTRVRSPGYFTLPESADNISASVSAEAVNGKTVYTNIMGYGSGGNLVSDYGWKLSGEAVTLSQEVTSFRICLRYSDSSSIYPSDIQSCSAKISYAPLSWHIGENGFPTNTEFIDAPAKAMDKPYPLAMWRIEETEYDGFLFSENGLPYNMLLPELKAYRFETVLQKDYITVYDHLTKQNDFNNNGLAVLEPISCNINEELNGEYSLEIKLPVDEAGKWTYIKEMNFIKALGQIFRINLVEYSDSGGKQEVTANAVHIFYQWNDAWVFPNSRLHPYKGLYGLLRELLINSRTYSFTDDSQVMFGYNYSSDIEDINTQVAVEKYLSNAFPNGSTPTEVIMGSDGFIANFGGELYRNNFYFSIDKRMEHSSDNAFEIRIGLNLKGIKRKVDLTTFCTYLKGYDNFGGWFAVSYTDTIVGIVPHHVTRTVNFQYDEPNEDVLASDTMKYFDQYCAPLISYTVDLEDVSGNSDFQEFTGKPSFKVGNIGTIYDERLGLPIKLKITRTKTDAITGKVTSVTFGATRQFMSHNYNSQVVGFDIPLHKDSAVPVTDVRGRKLKTLDNYRIMRRLEV